MKEKRSEWWKTIAGLLVVAVVAVGLGLLLRGQGQAPVATEPTATEVATATPTTVIALTETAPTSSTPVTVGMPTETAQPESTVAMPSLDDYAFSEPRVVLTHTSAIGIANWLPDGQHLLITRLVPGQPREYIETFNVQTGELRRYGERESFNVGFDPKPIWLAFEQVVVFSDFSDGRFVLWIGQDEGVLEERSIIGLASPYLAVNPSGQQVVFLPEATEGRPQIFDVVQSQKVTLPFTLPLPSQQDSSVSEPYKITWHPDGNRVGFYNDAGFYLADLTTGQIYEVDLGVEADSKRWAVDARWSPDGRYLAVLTTIGDPIVPFIDLMLIDIHTGEQRHFSLDHQYLYSIAWINSRHLLVGAEIDQDQTGESLYGLYLVDAVTGDSRQMVTKYQSIGDVFWGIAWSAIRQEIALACPTFKPTDGTIAEGRLCIIAVEVK